MLHRGYYKYPRRERESLEDEISNLSNQIKSLNDELDSYLSIYQEAKDILSPRKTKKIADGILNIVVNRQITLNEYHKNLNEYHKKKQQRPIARPKSVNQKYTDYLVSVSVKSIPPPDTMKQQNTRRALLGLIISDITHKTKFEFRFTLSEYKAKKIVKHFTFDEMTRKSSNVEVFNIVPSRPPLPRRKDDDEQTREDNSPIKGY